MSLHGNGVVLVDPMTDSWTAQKIGMYSLDRRTNAKCPRMIALLATVTVANAASTSAASLLAQSPKWRLLREDEKSSWEYLDVTKTGEPIKTIASLSNPAYSADGAAAAVLMRFRWSIHDALAQYLVERTADTWKVTCSELVFYP
jgi:hypothetical protein